jgi:hypothetical protein
MIVLWTVSVGAPPPPSTFPVPTRRQTADYLPPLTFPGPQNPPDATGGQSRAQQVTGGKYTPLYELLQLPPSPHIPGFPSAAGRSQRPADIGSPQSSSSTLVAQIPHRRQSTPYPGQETQTSAYQSNDGRINEWRRGVNQAMQDTQGVNQAMQNTQGLPGPTHPRRNYADIYGKPLKEEEAGTSGNQGHK